MLRVLAKLRQWTAGAAAWGLLLAAFSLQLAAQVSVAPFKTPRATFTDQNGLPLAGGCVYSYAGGTSTPQATYTDFTGSTPNANPVILDSTGSAVMWLGPYTYKFVAWSNGGTNCSTGTNEWTVDQVPGNTYLNVSISGATIANSTITNSTVDSTPIGGSSPSSVAAAYFSGPIGTGGGTPAAGKFTQLATPVNSMTFSATPVFLASSYSTFLLTLTGNVTSSTAPGGMTGQVINFEVCQNATGGYTFAWPSTFVNAPTMPTTASVCITPQFFYDGAYWQYLNNTAAATGGAYGNVTWSATPVFAVNPAYVFGLTLTGSVTSSTITGSTAGAVIGFDICQNATGGFTLAWPASFLNAPSMPLAPSACITPQFFYNGTNWILLTPNAPLSAQTVTFSTTPTFNAAGYNAFTLTISANVTSSTLNGGVPGQWVSLNICQNATGGFTFAWPTGLLNAPLVNTTASACTDVLAIYNGSNWLTAASSGTLAVTCSGGNCYRQNGDGSFEEWGTTPTFGGGSGGSFSLTWPHAFTSLSSIVAVFSPTQCDGGNAAYCAGNPGGSPNNTYNCMMMTASLTAPTIAYSSSNTVSSPAACTFHVMGY